MRWLLLISALSSSWFAHAQSSKPANTTILAEPVLTTPATFGLVSGQKQTVTLTGNHLKDVTSIHVIGLSPHPVASITSASANELKVDFDVPAECPRGLYELRVGGPYGLSAARPIVIDSLPVVAKSGTIDRVGNAQTVTWPCVIVGNVANETADYYRVKVKAGQTVTFDCFAKRLGSPLDPVIILHDGKTGRELSSLYADDTPGLQTDARFVHTFAKDEEYVVCVRDTTYKGSDNHRYRLRISEGPAAMMAYPPFSASRSGGPYDFIPQINVPIPSRTDMTMNHGWLPIGGAQWPVPVWPGLAVPVVETEPNQEIKSANTLPIQGLTARFAEKNDVDFFSFTAKKDQSFEIVAKTAEIGSPCEVLIAILDKDGKKLAESDPQKTIAKAEFKAPAEGTYYAKCEPLNFQFGPFEVYHLSSQEKKPAFTYKVGTDRVTVPEGNFGLLPITAIEKKNGFEGPATITIGKNEITVHDTVTPENPAYIPIRQDKDLALMTMANGSAADTARKTLEGLPHLPPGWAERVHAWKVPSLSIEMKAPQTIEAKAGETKFDVSIDRDQVEGDIAVSVLGLPANVTAKAVTVKPDDGVFTIALTVDAKAESSKRIIFLRAEANGRRVHAGPIELNIIKAAKSAEPTPPKKSKTE